MVILDNPNMLYALVRTNAKFERLRDFNLEKAVGEIERVRQLKEEKLQRNKQQQTPRISSVPEDNKSATSNDNTAPTTAAEAVEDNNKTDDQKQVDEPFKENDSQKEDKQEQQSPQQQDGLSEKARGKLPESTAEHGSGSGSNSGSNNNNLAAPPLPLAAAPERQGSTSSFASTTSTSTVQLPGFKNGFIATEDWVSQWHSQLPLQPILVLLEHLVPQVQTLCSTQALTSDAQVLEFLRGMTLVGILPAPQPIFIRKFRWGEALVIWFRSMLWGQAYVASMTDYCPWGGTQVKLFQIKQQIVGNNNNNNNNNTVGASDQQQQSSITSPRPLSSSTPQQPPTSSPAAV